LPQQSRSDPRESVVKKFGGRGRPPLHSRDQLQLVPEEFVGFDPVSAFDEYKAGVSAGAASGKLSAFDAGYFVLRGVCRVVDDFVNSRPQTNVSCLEFITSLYRHSSSI